MRKNIFKITIILFVLTAVSFAAPLNSALLSEVENNFFGIDYPKDTDLGRIQRIEKVLYGTTQAGELEDRLKKIASDTGTVVKQKGKPKTQKSVPVPDSLSNSVPEQKHEDYVAEDSSVNYPIVDKMEQKLYSKTYDKENIYTRIDRLEKKVFNKSYANEILNSRVERLSDTLLYSEKTAKQDDSGYLPYPQQIKKNTQVYDKYQNSTGTYTDDNMSVMLATLERNAFGNVYMSDSVGQRLNRLENKVLGKTFSDDTPKNRIERLSSVVMAQNNSYIYDNNKTMRNVATFSQIGGIILMILAMIL